MFFGGRFERIAWLVFLISALAVVVYLTETMVREFHEEKVNARVTTEQFDEMQFPSIILCSMNGKDRLSQDSTPKIEMNKDDYEKCCCKDDFKECLNGDKAKVLHGLLT